MDRPESKTPRTDAFAYQPMPDILAVIGGDVGKAISQLCGGWMELCETLELELAAAGAGDPSCPVVSYQRKWAADGEVPYKVKGRWPAKFKILDVTKVRVFPDDVPLIRQPDYLAAKMTSLQLQWQFVPQSLPPDPEGNWFSPMVWLALSDGTVKPGQCLHRGKDATYDDPVHGWFVMTDKGGPNCSLDDGITVIAWMPFAVPIAPFFVTPQPAKLLHKEDPK